MDAGVRALLSGTVAFVVATAAALVADPDRDLLAASTLGGTVGGSVALTTFLVASRLPDGDDRR